MGNHTNSITIKHHQQQQQRPCGAMNRAKKETGRASLLIFRKVSPIDRALFLTVLGALLLSILLEP